MPHNIRLTIEYDGTHFHGWQIQNSKDRTIQGELEKACKKLFGKPIRIIGSGRTDSGVHAAGQVAHFKVNSLLTMEKIHRALNALLPEDIGILAVEDAKPNFHARYSAKSKVYRYTILNRKSRGALQRDFSYFYPYPLNLRIMKTAAKGLIGRHNFKSFQATPPADEAHKSTVRTIKRILMTQKGEFLFMDIEANGFLHKMVRNIVGTLLEIGSGRLPEGSIKEILAKKNRIYAGKTAPAKGLCLLKVRY